jgi:hypothetical protein
MHLSASDSNAHAQLFSSGVKRHLFSHCSRTLAESRVFRKVVFLFRRVGFHPHFRQYSRNQPLDQVKHSQRSGVRELNSGPSQK